MWFTGSRGGRSDRGAKCCWRRQEAIHTFVTLMKFEEIATEAEKLSEKERATLASRLLRGLESPIYEVGDPELRKRMREAASDPAVWITFNQLVSGLDRQVS